MRSLFLLLTCALLSCLPAPLLCAEDDPSAPAPASARTGQDKVRARIATWLADLRDEAFRVREAARAGLEREGLQARDLLEAAAKSPDPEVRRTVAAILARLPSVAVVRQGDVHPGDFEALGRMSLDFEDVPLPDALAALGERLGGRFRLPSDLEQRTVTLHVKDVPCFAALAALLNSAGLRMPEPFDAQGTARLVPSQDDVTPAPQAFAGPLRIRVEAVMATRTFGPNQAVSYQVKLRLDWAPFVQLYSHRTARVEVARDPEGSPFLPASSMKRVGKRYVGMRAHSTVVDVHLVPGPEGCKPELGALEISVPMTLRYDRAQVVLADTARIPVVLAVSGEPVGPEQDESVSFLSLEPSGQGQGGWIAQYAARLKREVSRGTLQAYVREKGGRLTPLYVAGGRSLEADGLVRITARSYRATKGKPTALVVSWCRREDLGELRFRVENIPLR